MSAQRHYINGMLGHVYPTSVCPCACAVRVEKAEHCSAAGQCDQALVISPEGCGQVKASKRGWGWGGWEWRRGGRGGWILDGWERGKRQRGSWRVCLSIMRNDAAVTVNEARVFAPSIEHTDIHLQLKADCSGSRCQHINSPIFISNALSC